MMTTPRACRSYSAPSQAGVAHAVLRVEAMPRRLRQRVEELMVACLPTQPPRAGAADWLSAEWFTQWRRSALRPGTVSCSQRLSAPRRELETFGDALAALAEEHGFAASVSYR